MAIGEQGNQEAINQFFLTDNMLVHPVFKCGDYFNLRHVRLLLLLALTAHRGWPVSQVKRAIL